MSGLWFLTARSTLAGAMFFPPAVMIRCFFRSVMRRKPSASAEPMSPVCSQPSTMVSAVASGFLKYPLKTNGPRKRISPSEATLCSMGGTTLPTLPSLTAPSRFAWVATVASVMP